MNNPNTPKAQAGDALAGDALAGDALAGDALAGDALAGDACPANEGVAWAPPRLRAPTWQG